MTTYKRKQFTFTFIDNIPENADELASYGVATGLLAPGVGAVINVEKAIFVETMLATDFYADFEPVDPPATP